MGKSSCKGHVVAVVAARNEVGTIENVLLQLGRAGVHAAVLIVNGCHDDTIFVARDVAGRLPYPLHFVWFRTPLGHDVPRAIGTYVAMRAFPAMMTVYVDGDWGGSFGPMLADFIEFASQSESDVVSVSWKSLTVNAKADSLFDTWRHAIAQQSIASSEAVPFALPMAIRVSTFHMLSPIWLANPGWWFASAIKAKVSWSVFADWDMSITGHQGRDSKHSQAMRRRIAVDGWTAQRWVDQKPSPKLPPFTDADLAVLPHRDLTRLLAFAGTAWYVG